VFSTAAFALVTRLKRRKVPWLLLVVHKSYVFSPRDSVSEPKLRASAGWDLAPFVEELSTNRAYETMAVPTPY